MSTKAPESVKAIDARIAKAEATVQKLVQKRKELLGLTVVECKCGLQFWIRDLTYIQTHWYTPPRGCTEGDYWNAGEGQWQCKCGHLNRLYNKPEIEKLKRLFKDVEDTYDD